MTSQEFSDWKRHPVTKIIFEQLESLIAEGKNELATTAGESPTLDARKGGAIQAYQNILETTFEEIEQQ